MADAGQVTYQISLDASGFTQGAEKASRSFDKLNEAADKSSEAIEHQAQELETILGGAYKEIAKDSAQVVAAQQAYSAVVSANEAKLKSYSAAIRAANAEQKSSHQEVLNLQNAVAQAEEQKNIQLQKYLSLRDKERANLVQIQNAYTKLQSDLATETSLRQQLSAAMEREQAAVNKVASIKREQATAQKQAAKDEAKAQADIAKAEEQAATTIVQNASKQLAAINQVRASHIAATEERKKQLAEEERAAKEAAEEEERAAKEAADSQALAFSLAANAVHEVINAVKRLTQEMINLAKEVVTIGADFETSMAQVAATSGMTASEVQRNISDYSDLVEAAKEAGLTTIYSATEAGEALNYLALAGYNVEDSIATMPDILTIAAAGAMDLGRASDMVTDAMNALDLEIDQTTTFIDKMAKTAQSSNTNVEQLGGAILTVGGTATVLAGGITEFDTALGIMANSGIKARQGGTALRQILLNLTDPTREAAEMIDNLGLKVFDAAGNMRPLNEIFGDLDKIMKDFSDEQRMKALGTIFDARQIRAATALMQGSGEAWDKLANKIDNATGAAEKMAETMRSNFNGAVNLAKSNVDALAITVYEGISKNITSLVQDAVPKLQQLNSVLASPEVQSRLERFSAQLKEIALKLLDKILDAVPKVINDLSRLTANLDALKISAAAIAALGIASQIDKITKAAKALGTFIATNPYAAVAVVLAEIISLIIRLKAEADAQKEAMVAKIRAENDAWEEQRNAIQSTIEEWEDYKETADEVNKQHEEHVDKVEALYNEYKRLKEEGKDTTLAMEALAQEIPELQQMLAEGKDSFEDITTSVTAYCEALERAHRLETAKDTYIQAVQTRDALEEEVEVARQAQAESRKAAEDAKQAWDDFIAETTKKNRTSDYTEWTTKEQNRYLELGRTWEALNDLYAENSVAYSQAASTYQEAQQAVLDSEDGFNEAMQEKYIAEGKTVKGRNKGILLTNEEYSKDMTAFNKRVSEQAEKESQAVADALTAGVNQVKDRVKLTRESESDALIDFYSGWFGSHEDWDKSNKDLLNHYDKYQDLREQKEKETRTQMEKDQKERDKLAKEREDSAKKEADRIEKEWVASVNKGLSDIDWLAGFEDWSDKELLDAYNTYLKDNEKFYQEHEDAAESFERKRKTLEKKIRVESEKESKEAAKEYVKNWTDGYDKLVDKAVKAYNQLEKDATSYRNNLLKGVELTATETKKVWDTATHNWKEEKVEVVSAKSLQEDLEQMKKVKAFLDSLKSQGADQSLIDQIMGSSSDEQQKFMEQFTKMSSGERSKYLSTWKELQTTANEMTEEYMTERVNDWEKNFWEPVQNYTATGGEELQKAMQLAGEDSVQGFIEGIQDKRNEAEGKTKELYEDVLNDAKKVLGIASPSKEFYAIGEFSIQGFLDGLTSRVSEVASIFQSLGQTAGDTFVNAFKSTWDNFVTLLNNTGGLPVPVSMTTTAFGTPVTQGAQVYYTGTGTSYSGLTKADVVSAIKEAVPNGDVILKVDESEFGRVSRSSLNLLAQQQGTMDLRV